MTGESSRWLGLAALVIFTQAVVAFVDRPGAIGAAGVALVAVISALLLRGSRFVWVIALTGALVQLVEAVVSGSVLLGAVNGLVGACLLMPESLRVVWRKRPPFQPLKRVPVVGSAYERLAEGALHLLAVAAGWEEGVDTPKA
jgi:hypothetical protein